VVVGRGRERRRSERGMMLVLVILLKEMKQKLEDIWCKKGTGVSCKRLRGSASGFCIGPGVWFIWMFWHGTESKKTRYPGIRLALQYRS
jgi:hypothetical protein